MNNLGFHSHGKLFSQLATKRGVEKSCPKIMCISAFCFSEGQKKYLCIFFFLQLFAEILTHDNAKMDSYAVGKSFSIIKSFPSSSYHLTS